MKSIFGNKRQKVSNKQIKLMREAELAGLISSANAVVSSIDLILTSTIGGPMEKVASSISRLAAAAERIADNLENGGKKREIIDVIAENK